MQRAQNNRYVLGVDIGGTLITAALVDIEKKELLRGSKKRLGVNSHGSADSILKTWVGTLKHVIAQSKKPVDHIGFAMPGPFDYENGISFIKDMHKYEALYGMDIRQHLSDELKMKASHICFRNDAEAFLAGEVFCGAAMGYDKAVGITLGTGLGSATSCDGSTRDVNLGSSLFLDGIAEDYISSRWFIQRYNEVTGRKAKDVEQLAKAAETDADVKSIFKEFTANLSAFLQKFIEDESPAVVIIGGGMAGASGIFLGDLRKSLKGNIAQIKISELGEDASMIGAASMHLQSEPVTL